MRSFGASRETAVSPEAVDRSLSPCCREIPGNVLLNELENMVAEPLLNTVMISIGSQEGILSRAKEVFDLVDDR